MPVSFNRIPAQWKIPLYYVEVDSSKAGLPSNVRPTLLVGVQNPASGSFKSTATADVPIPIASQEQANYAFGTGSMLANMFKAYFRNNWAGQVYGLPLAEGTTGATGTITVTSAPTSSGTLHLYIGGAHVSVPLVGTETVTTAGDAIEAAIEADVNLPFTAANAAGTVTLTAKAKGTWANGYVFSDSFYGAVGGEQRPAGLALTYTSPTNGAGVPTMTTAISNLGETEVEYVCLPFTDTTSLAAWETEFGFSDVGRWGWIRQLYGGIFSAKKDTVANLETFGPGRNCPQLSVLGLEEEALSPDYEWAAAYCAKAARALSNDPARPLQSLHLEGIMPAPAQNRFALSELNALASYGIATQRTLSGENVPFIARESTTATKNAYGVADDAFDVVPTLNTLATILRNQRQVITSKYARHKLADDGARFGPGQAIVTPKTVKAELVAQYRIDEFQGLVENAQAFKDNLIVERDVNDVNRLNILFPPDLTNQLRVFAVLAQFRLQYSRGIDVSML